MHSGASKTYRHEADNSVALKHFCGRCRGPIRRTIPPSAGRWRETLTILQATSEDCYSSGAATLMKSGGKSIRSHNGPVRHLFEHIPTVVPIEQIASGRLTRERPRSEQLWEVRMGQEKYRENVARVVLASKCFPLSECRVTSASFSHAALHQRRHAVHEEMTCAMIQAERSTYTFVQETFLATGWSAASCAHYLFRSVFARRGSSPSLTLLPPCKSITKPRTSMFVLLARRWLYSHLTELVFTCFKSSKSSSRRHDHPPRTASPPSLLHQRMDVGSLSGWEFAAWICFCETSTPVLDEVRTTEEKRRNPSSHGRPSERLRGTRGCARQDADRLTPRQQAGAGLDGLCRIFLSVQQDEQCSRFT